MSKNMVDTEGPQMTSQYGAYALNAGSARPYELMRMHTPTRPGTHMHAHMRKHAHTDQYVTIIAFPQQRWFRERSSMLRYTYIACIVFIYCDIDITWKQKPAYYKMPQWWSETENISHTLFSFNQYFHGKPCRITDCIYTLGLACISWKQQNSLQNK